MVNVLKGIVLGVLFSVGLTACTFTLDGLKATDGDKNLTLDHIETTE